MGHEFSEDPDAEGRQIDAAEFFRWQFTEDKGSQALDYIEAKFSTFEVIEHFGSTWKLKVSRDNYSIGWLFGMMEDIQAKYHISEYSVAQTTLEQIFNNFALKAEQEQGGYARRRYSQRRSSKKNKDRANLIE